MTLTLLIETAAKSVATSGVTLLLLQVLIKRSAAERSWIAHLGLAATLLLPLAALLGPSWHVMPALDASPATIAPAPAILLPAVEASHGAAAAAQVQPVFDLHPDTLALILYAIPALALLAVTVFAVLRLFALRGRAVVLVEPPWLSALAHAQRRMGFKNGAALLVSDELRSPVSWGLFRPTIVVNQELLEGGAEAEAIIAHELAHVARLDWVKLLLSRAATAIYWFNPLVWMLANQCHQLREEAADDAVIQAKVSRTDYAALLVGAARHESRGLLLAANGVAPSRGSLKRRVVRVLDGAISRRPARIGWSLASTLAALAVAGPLAALTTEAALAPPARPAPAASIAIAKAESQSNTRARPVVRQPAPARAKAPAISQPEISPRPPARIEVGDLTGLRTLELSLTDVRKMTTVSPLEGRFDVTDLIGLHVRGVDEAWLKQMKALGYNDLTASQIDAMTVHHITPRFVREMAAAGYSGLTVEQLVNMKVLGVTPDYAAEWTESGARLSPDEVIKLRVTGVRPSKRPWRADDDGRRPPRPPRPPSLPSRD